FSSRRRHTRSDRDWSSDVCSSDLGVPVTTVQLNVDQRTPLMPHTLDQSIVEQYRKLRTKIQQQHATQPIRSLLIASPGAGEGKRSEEHTSELQSRSDLVCRLLLEK